MALALIIAIAVNASASMMVKDEFGNCLLKSAESYELKRNGDLIISNYTYNEKGTVESTVKSTDEWYNDYSGIVELLKPGEKVFHCPPAGIASADANWNIHIARGERLEEATLVVRRGTTEYRKFTATYGNVKPGQSKLIRGGYYQDIVHNLGMR